MRYQDIPQFPHAYYEVDVPWEHLDSHLARFAEQGLDLDPDFQRGHVWTTVQQVAFVEHMLRGGKSPRHIYFNCADWKRARGAIQLVDGKQRLEAARRFIAGRLPVFGGLTASDLGECPPFNVDFRFHVHTLQTRREVLEWYLAMNSGGSVHTESELARVRALLAVEPA